MNWTVLHSSLCNDPSSCAGRSYILTLLLRESRAGMITVFVSCRWKQINTSSMAWNNIDIILLSYSSGCQKPQMRLNGLKSRCPQGCIIFLKALRENLVSGSFSTFRGCPIPWLLAPLPLQNQQWPVQSFSDHILLTLLSPFPISRRTLGMKMAPWFMLADEQPSSHLEL